MSKLYPPDIGGVIPAFYGNTITIPFTMNKLVANIEVEGFALVFKSVANSKVLYSTKAEYNSNTKQWEGGNWNTTASEVTFNLPNNTFRIGQHYKVQMSYINGSIPSFWSNVATVKYTAYPNISISNLEKGKENFNPGAFLGYYNSENDASEKVYSYRFDIFDKQGNLYETSGDCLHNSTTDMSTNESQDTYTLTKDLQPNETYKIQYSVITTNKLKVSSASYLLVQKDTVDPELRAKVIAELHKDNGYIKVRLEGEITADGIEPAAIGRFRLKRSCSKDNYSIWQTVYDFKLNGQLPSAWSWKDMTIEHGYKYQYGLEQYSETLTSNKILSNEVYAEFEDAFLYDGTKQLKIKFNPKISSFKTTILEAKQDTIGSKYPFFFRNGRVAYKEFPISGLISYHADEEELFMTNEEILLNDLLLDPRETNLTDVNVAAERIFKIKVLDWLNDGTLKLFRSPTEGNYIVRLLNVSLAPTDQLGRMLHTFSATAYEAKELTYNAIVNLGFLSLGDIEEKYTTRWETITLYKETSKGPEPYITETNVEGVPLINNPSHKLTSLTIYDATPGTQFRLMINGIKGSPITIGSSGTYKIDLEDNLLIDEVYIFSIGVIEGYLTYSYESSVQNTFDTITDVQVNDWFFVQYIGEHEDVIGEMEERVSKEDSIAANNWYNKQNDTTGNRFVIDKPFQGLRKTVSGLKYLRFYKREVYDIYKVKKKYYWNLIESNNDETGTVDFVPLFVYNAITDTQNYYDTNLLLNNRGDLDKSEVNKPNVGARVITLYTTANNNTKFYEDRYCQEKDLVVNTTLLLPDRYPNYFSNFKAKYANAIFEVVLVEYVDGNTGKIISNHSNSFIINNDSVIDLTETGSFLLPADFDIQTLQLSSGVIFECAYQTKEIIYSLEINNSQIQKLKQRYETFLNYYYERLHWLDYDKKNTIASSQPDTLQEDNFTPKEEYSIQSYYNSMIYARNVFLIALHQAVEELKEATGYYV